MAFRHQVSGWMFFLGPILLKLPSILGSKLLRPGLVPKLLKPDVSRPLRRGVTHVESRRERRRLISPDEFG